MFDRADLGVRCFKLFLKSCVNFNDVDSSFFAYTAVLVSI